MNVTTLMMDSKGLLATNGEMSFYLTPCCNAAAKGTTNGIQCKDCHRFVPSMYGMGWMNNDAQTWKTWQLREIKASSLVNGKPSFNNINIMKELTDTVIERVS